MLTIGSDWRPRILMVIQGVYAGRTERPLRSGPSLPFLTRGALLWDFSDIMFAGYAPQPLNIHCKRVFHRGGKVPESWKQFAFTIEIYYVGAGRPHVKVILRHLC